MAVTDKLNTEVLGWVTLGIIIVVGSVVLLQIKSTNISGITCGTGFDYNVTSNSCCATSTNCVGANTTAVGNVAGTIDKFVAGIAEPENWVAIVIIAIIGFAVLAIFMRKK